jgi:Na+/H+-dicarboxylate symporter
MRFYASSERTLLRFTSKVLLIWAVETVFGAVTYATWGYFSEYNSTSLFKILWEGLLIYASIKAVFHLLPYWIGHRFLPIPINESVSHFVVVQTGLFVLASAFAAKLFAWNLFFHDLYLGIASIISSVSAAYLLGYWTRRRALRLKM